VRYISLSIWEMNPSGAPVQYSTRFRKGRFSFEVFQSGSCGANGTFNVVLLGVCCMHWDLCKANAYATSLIPPHPCEITRAFGCPGTTYCSLYFIYIGKLRSKCTLSNRLEFRLWPLTFNFSPSLRVLIAPLSITRPSQRRAMPIAKSITTEVLMFNTDIYINMYKYAWGKKCLQYFVNIVTYTCSRDCYSRLQVEKTYHRKR
jgi:hypothetical protein